MLSFPLVRVSSARIKSTSFNPDGSKGHVFEISIGVGTIYNFDIRGSAGILLVLDGNETIVTLVKEAVLF
jgi:hypothetical protein